MERKDALNAWAMLAAAEEAAAEARENAGRRGRGARSRNSGASVEAAAAAAGSTAAYETSLMTRSGRPKTRWKRPNKQPRRSRRSRPCTKRGTEAEAAARRRLNVY